MFGISVNIEEKYSLLKATKKTMGILGERLNDLKKAKIRLHWQIEAIMKDERPLAEEEITKEQYNDVVYQIKEVENQLIVLNKQFEKDRKAICAALFKIEQAELNELGAEMSKHKGEMNRMWREYIHDQKNPVKKDAVFSLRHIITSARDKMEAKRRIVNKLANESLLCVEEIMTNA